MSLVPGQLVAGEGIETVLAAATRMTYQGAPLIPVFMASLVGPLDAGQNR
jgi:hypothetical protein